MQLKNKSLLLTPLAAAMLIASACVSQSRTWGEEEGAEAYEAAHSESAAKESSSSAAQVREASMSKSAPAGMVRSSLAYPTGDKKTSALLLDKLAPREITAGQAFEYEIQVANLTSMALDNVTVTETLPPNFTMSGSVPQALKAAGGVATWDLGKIDANGEKSIRIKGTAREAGMVTTCSSVAYNTGVCMSIPVVQPALQLVANGTSKAMTCDPVEYTYKVTNSGTGSARNVVVKVPLPAGITVDGKTSVSKTIPALASGESYDFTVNGKPSKRGDFSHTATATADGGLTASASVIKTTICEPVLEIAKLGAKKEFLGKDLRYDITIKNTGDAPAKNTILEDRLPAGTRFESATDSGRAQDGVVRWNLGTLAPNASKKVSLVISSDRAGSLTNRASAKADCANPVEASWQTEVTGIPAVLLEVIDVEDPVRVGDTETYVITVTNQGSAQDTNVKIECTLPPNVEYVSATGTTAAMAGAGADGVVRFTPVGILAPKAKATWSVVVRGKSAADARFTVVLNTDQLTRPVQENEATYFYE